MKPRLNLIRLMLLLLLAGGAQQAQAQGGNATAKVRIDASKVVVGDAARVFLEVQQPSPAMTIQWAQIPDSFSKLEILARNPIDTTRMGSRTIYKQTLSVTGFDSGMFTIPSFHFTIQPKGGSPYVLSTDSLQLLVQTVPVDTSKAFRPIKGVITVQYTWRDYLWVIIGGLVFLALAAFVIFYFVRNKRHRLPLAETGPQESLQEKALKLLAALDAEQLWQKGLVKEYYVRLTDILRGYVEARFATAALELTTDELIDKARVTPGLVAVAGPLERILRTADLAKFAKAQPLPQEHMESMELARQLITATPPVAATTPQNAAE